MFSSVSTQPLKFLPLQKSLNQNKLAAYIPDYLIDPVLLAESYRFQPSVSTALSPLPADTFQNQDGSASVIRPNHEASSSMGGNNGSPSSETYEKARYAALSKLAIENDMEPDALFALADFARSEHQVDVDGPTSLPADLQRQESRYNEIAQPEKKRKHEAIVPDIAKASVKRRASSIESTADYFEPEIDKAYLQRAKKACELGITMRDYRKIIYALQLKHPDMTVEEKAEWGIPEKETRGRLNENTGLSAVEVREKHRHTALKKVGLSRTQERSFGLFRQMQRLGIKDSKEMAALRREAKGLGLTLEQLCQQQGRVKPMSDEAVRLLQMASGVKQSNKDRYQKTLLRCRHLGLNSEAELQLKRKEAQAQGLTVEELVAKEREAKASSLGLTIQEIIEREEVPSISLSRRFHRSPFVRIEQVKPNGPLWVRFKVLALKNALSYNPAQPEQKFPVNPFVQIDESRTDGRLMVRFKLSSLRQRLLEKDVSSGMT